MDYAVIILTITSIIYLFFGWFVSISSVVFVCFVLVKRRKPVSISPSIYVWMIIAVVLGLLAPFVISMNRFITIEKSEIPQYTLNDGILIFASLILSNLFFSALIQEIVYRGFAWHLVDSWKKKRSYKSPADIFYLLGFSLGRAIFSF
jgi:hypothetical protein